MQEEAPERRRRQGLLEKGLNCLPGNVPLMEQVPLEGGSSDQKGFCQEPVLLPSLIQESDPSPVTHGPTVCMCGWGERGVLCSPGQSAGSWWEGVAFHSHRP